MTTARLTAIELITTALAMVAAFVPIQAEGIERWFSIGLYPAIQHIVTPVSNVLPFALLDVLSAAALAGVVIVLRRAGRAAWRTRRLLPIFRALGHLAAGSAFVYLAFLLLWGFNYRRVPMTERLLVQPGAPSSGAVVMLGLEAVAGLNALHPEAHRRGWREPPWQDEALRRSFAAVQRALSDAPLAEPGRLKGTMFGPYFRWTSIDAMINPFGLEVLANPDLLSFERPFVAAHEWSHLAGYADEAEASFVGWLTCMSADTPAQYSGWLFLYGQISAEVSGDDRARLGEALAAGPRADVEAIVDRLRRGQLPWLRTAGWRLYDEYLKANRVEEGVRSYGAAVTLILRARVEQGRMPVRRAPPTLDQPGS